MTTTAYKKAFGDWDGIETQQADFPGILLTLHGQYDAMDSKRLARAYADNTLRLIKASMNDLDTPEWAFPPLFLARHTLELYLRNCYPNYDELLKEKKLKGGRHRIDYLLDHLYDDLDPNIASQDTRDAFDFLKTFHRIDPKSMAFRFVDGAIESFCEDRSGNRIFPAPDLEIPVNFQALYEALQNSFSALDRIVCLLETKRSTEISQEIQDGEYEIGDLY